MGVILDTSIWIDVERGWLAPADVAEITGEEFVYLVPPILAELEYGIHKASDSAVRNRRASALAKIRHKPCLTIDKETAVLFGRLAADVDRAGRPFVHRVHDLWIAALAIQHDMAVLTRNRRDFEGIPGLKLVVI